MNQSKKNKARLERRRADFDSMKSEGQGGRPNSKRVLNKDGKKIVFHRPGSLKK